MISNTRQNRGGEGLPGRSSRQSGVPEETLRTEQIQIERKTFILALKENPRGRFLRITEDISGRRDSIIVPAPGLAEFKRVLEGMIQTDAETPVKLAPVEE